MVTKGLLFDFGQTLVDSSGGFRAAEKATQLRICRDLGSPPWEKFLSTYRALRQEFQSSSEFSRKALWEAIYRRYQRDPGIGTLENWVRDYWQTVAAGTRPFPETEVVLGALAPRYRLGLVTNTQGANAPGLHRLKQFPELEKYFTFTVIAGEGRVPPKPDPTPFRLCLEGLGLGAAEAVYVGDDWRIDICGAQAAGVRPIWLQHHLVPRTWPTVQAMVPIITNLDQLPELVDV